MPKTHNKKRNVGVIYELLVCHISKCLVENDKKRSKAAIKILKKHFQPNTELYKEFRLFSALARATVSTPGIAASILSEAKQAARSCDIKKLDKEKSALIRDINYRLNDTGFYRHRIGEYRIYATIQTLLNDWRSGMNADLRRVADYEDKISSWLTSEKEKINLFEDGQPQVDDLVIKIMMEKLNKKFNHALSVDQKEIVQQFVFNGEDKNGVLRERLEQLKSRTLSSLHSYTDNCDNQILIEKIDDVKNRISKETLEVIDESTIKRFLVLSQLKNELEAEK